MTPNPRDLVGLPLAASRALRPATDLLERAPQIESAITAAVSRAQDTLDQLLEGVRPIEAELQTLQESAATLERQLSATERQIAATDQKVGELEDLVAHLIELAIRFEGAAEHLLDRVPGLSPDRAEERAEKISRATRPGRAARPGQAA